jgi:hypothetical protein
MGLPFGPVRSATSISPSAAGETANWPNRVVVLKKEESLRRLKAYVPATALAASFEVDEVTAGAVYG